MKKQILFLTFLSLAFVFAGVNKVYGQLNVEVPYLDGAIADGVCPTSEITLSCTDDGLTPIPGKPYLYSLNVTSPGNTTVHWFVTADADVILSQGTDAANLATNIDGSSGFPGTYLMSAGGNAAGLGADATYNDGDNVGLKLEATWNYFTTDNVLLVAYAVAADGCTDNIQAWEITPVNKFALDIIALNDNGTDGTGGSECVSPIQSANYAGDVLNVDYGTNWVFFRVRAANFTGSWTPEFTASGVTGIGDVEWAYPGDATANDAGNWNAATDPVTAVGGATAAVGGIGECIIVRVPVDHGTNEFLTDGTVTLDVSGLAYDGSDYTLEDVSEDCTVGDTDEASYTITKRPTIDNPSPTPFETKTGF